VAAKAAERGAEEAIMLSSRLLQRVETHWDAIAAAVIEQASRDPHTPHHKELDDQELLARCSDLIQHLGQWLTSQDEGTLERRYEEVGHDRFMERIPLAEVVYKVHLIEQKTVDYIQHANVAQSAVEIFSELEMLRALHRFFAIVVYAVVTGYEKAATGTWIRRAVA
jgi:hypothetical protein